MASSSCQTQGDPKTPLDRFREAPRVWPALLGPLRNRPQHCLFNRHGQRGVVAAWRWRCVVDVLVQHRQMVLCRERGAAGNHLVRDDAQAVDVGRGSDRIAFRLLGAHVLRCSHDRPDACEPGAAQNEHEAKVQKRRVPVLSDHDVAGLDVAVNHVLFVGVVQRVGYLIEDAEHLRRGKRLPALNHGFEGFARQILHGDEVIPLVFIDLIDGDDVRMAQLGFGSGASAESPYGLII